MSFVRQQVSTLQSPLWLFKIYASSIVMSPGPAPCLRTGEGGGRNKFEGAQEVYLFKFKGGTGHEKFIRVW